MVFAKYETQHARNAQIMYSKSSKNLQRNCCFRVTNIYSERQTDNEKRNN